ncbi:hypothetical protein GCM10011415_14300 [Salipiger pallidus]|uniref:Uncharacterized protein n=1 Tax=Salipiger pallidus TaxID=1775170 RepID=A0A8J2ZIT0_9RHOB|nr:hypothetical protein [Salipiger pallidus]GGG68260.1 hypothetical protein GCM10011415_14300 [Salipiger pallidus]
MIGRITALILLALWAAPLCAEGFVIDFAEVFDRNAANIQVATPGVEHLELPGPVIVERRGRRIRAEDQSGWGPAGCALDRLVTAAAAVLECPALFTPEQRDKVAGQLLRGVDFFAENTVPPMTQDARRAAMQDALAVRRAALGLSCATGVHPALAFAAHIAEDDSLARFERIFARPRLPVSRPCR